MFRNILKSLPIIYKGLPNLKTKVFEPCFFSIGTVAPFKQFSTIQQTEEKKQVHSDEIIDESENEGQEFDDLLKKKNKKEPRVDLKTHIEEFQYVEVDNKVLVKCSFGYFSVKGAGIQNDKLKKMKNIYFIHDQIPVNYLRKILKEDDNALVIFEPSSHYFNMTTIYNGYRKKLYLQYFGTKKKPRNPFKNCKNEHEVFNLNRRIQAQIRAVLSRICVIVNYDATLRIKGANIPFSDTLKNILQEDGSNKLGMYKFNYIVPVNYWLGIHSSDEWEKKGIAIDCLGGKKIYPLYSVWSPTNQHYLSLLVKYLEEKRNTIRSKKGVIDIGCGTGILSFMLIQLGGCKEVHAIDSNIKAAECTKLNSQILDVAGAIKVGYYDLVNTIKSDKSTEVLKNMQQKDHKCNKKLGSQQSSSSLFQILLGSQPLK